MLKGDKGGYVYASDENGNGNDLCRFSVLRMCFHSCLNLALELLPCPRVGTARYTYLVISFDASRTRSTRFHNNKSYLSRQRDVRSALGQSVFFRIRSKTLHLVE